MAELYMITDGRRTSYVEFESPRTGAIATTNVWRQRKPFNKGLLENIMGKWAYVPRPSGPIAAPVPVDLRSLPQLLLEDPQGRRIMEFDEWPRDGRPASGRIIRPDGWTDRVTMTRVAAKVDPAKAWMGLCFKGGVTVVAAGKEALVGSLWNLGSDDIGFPFVAVSDRLGLGAGASGGLSLCIGYGFTTAQAALGTGLGGWDFNLSLGPRWSAWLKAARLANPETAKGFMKLARLRVPMPRNISGLMSISAEVVHSENALNLFKNLIGLSNFDDRMRCVVTFDLPISGGLEISVVTTDGKVVAVDPISAQRYLTELAGGDAAMVQRMRYDSIRARKEF